jgi:segregation and condensation protein B
MGYDMGRRPRREDVEFDRELHDLPEPLRRRQFMQNIEAVIFHSSKPVSREQLGSVIGKDCNLDDLVAEIREEWRLRPFEIVKVAGGYQARTRLGYAAVLHAAGITQRPLRRSASSNSWC